MNVRNQLTAVALVLSSFLVFWISGCVTDRKAIVTGPGPSCEDALNTGLDAYSDQEVAEFLDRALADEKMDACWIPIMRSCLDENREIPHRHLAQAIKTFNQRRYQVLFHQAVYRYLADIEKGHAPYRPEDKALLTEYLSYLIHHAPSAHDQKLARGQMLCQRLDPGLYRKLFQ